jgi:hypothetical protein
MFTAALTNKLEAAFALDVRSRWLQLSAARSRVETLQSADVRAVEWFDGKIKHKERRYFPSKSASKCAWILGFNIFLLVAHKSQHKHG